MPKWQQLLTTYDIAYDDFIRTTESRHTEQVVEVFERLKRTGDVYLGKYEGWYCTNDETFWLESKLVDGRCPNAECRRAVQWLSEDNWFFALSKYQDRLRAYYRDNPQWCAAGTRVQRDDGDARRRSSKICASPGSISNGACRCRAAA